MKSIFILLTILLSTRCFSQDTLTLRQYLFQHRYVINLKDEHSFNMLPGLMKDKNLFVMGEGGSHDLPLNAQLKYLLINQLATQNLKYYFIEFGRSIAYYYNHYLVNDYKGMLTGNENYWAGCDVYFSFFDKIKKQTGNNPHFKIIGIDFERKRALYSDINYLFNEPDYSKMPVSKTILERLKDTSYFKLSFRKFGRFYKKLGKDFLKDSLEIKTETGDRYNDLKYLLTNKNRKSPNIDRNCPMARNLVTEITPMDTSGLYFLSIGIAHSIPCNHHSAVHIMGRNKPLKNKILVMNVFCENFTPKNRKPFGLKYLRNDLLKCFSNAANGDLVLFDLSQLPPEYAFIKNHGELLLFAKNQQMMP